MTNPQGLISPMSRLGGALITFVWGMIMLVITLLLLAMIPPINPPLQKLYKDIHMSKVYHIIKPLDSSAIDKPSREETIESLSKDKRIQEIVNDPKITEAIHRKDYAALMSNPKIMALVQDPKMVRKMMSIYKEVLQQQTNP